MTLVFCPSADGVVAIPDTEETHHLLNVLRKRSGDEVVVTDGKGRGWIGRIDIAERKLVRIDLLQETAGPQHWGYHLHLAIAPPKHSGRLEWLLEKVTEIGVDRITLLETWRTERTRWRYDRLEKLIIAAVKQSGQFTMPRLDERDMTLAQFFQTCRGVQANKFIATCDWGNLKSLSGVYAREYDTVLMIGPEGDFTPEEVELARSESFTPVLLGTNRLRTETAAVVACAQIHVLHEKA